MSFAYPLTLCSFLGPIDITLVDSKAEVEEYIRTLPIKSVFFARASFMQKFGSSMAPRPTGDGIYAIFSIVTSQTQMPLIDALLRTRASNLALSLPNR
ncbi:hypothetical protein V1517DRAFT_328849 [Lipomyces orientalis]|uniref:Uncharacterized protein n=1 Tax=Lipomyces orientalis TaxID=1233043 RepID=A0ACC3THM9_9ASCO